MYHDYGSISKKDLTKMSTWVYDDGGREKAGYKGNTGDCVVRAIAIASGKSYQEVYNAINTLALNERVGKRKKKISNARTGVYKQTTHKYLSSIGATWTPTMKIGTGCKVHLDAKELPLGRLVVKLSRHLTAVIDGVIHDTYDPQRETVWYENGEVSKISKRCVYGYWRIEK